MHLDQGPVCSEDSGGSRNIVLERDPNFCHGFDAAFAKLFWPLVPYLLHRVPKVEVMLT